MFDYLKKWNLRKSAYCSPNFNNINIQNKIRDIRKEKPELSSLSDNGISVLLYYYLEYHNNEKVKEATDNLFDYEASSIDRTYLQSKYTDCIEYSNYLQYNINKYTSEYYTITNDYIPLKVLLQSSHDHNHEFIETDIADIHSNLKKKKCNNFTYDLDNVYKKSKLKYSKNKKYTEKYLGVSFEYLMPQIEFYLNGYRLHPWSTNRNLPMFSRVTTNEKYFFNYNPNKITFYSLMCYEDHNGAYHNVNLKLKDYDYGNFYIGLSKNYNLDLTYIKTIEELMDKLKEIDHIAEITKQQFIICFSGHANSGSLSFSKIINNKEEELEIEKFKNKKYNPNSFPMIEKYALFILFDGCSTGKIEKDINKPLYGDIIDLNEDINYEDYPLAAYACNYFQKTTLASCDSVSCSTYFGFNKSKKFSLVSRSGNNVIMTNKFVPDINNKVKVYSSNIRYTNSYYLEGDLLKSQNKKISFTNESEGIILIKKKNKIKFKNPKFTNSSVDQSNDMLDNIIGFSIILLGILFAYFLSSYIIFPSLSFILGLIYTYFFHLLYFLLSLSWVLYICISLLRIIL